MTTGLDAAAAAVGTASFAIQVCQGLLDYYGDWKDFKDDIRSSPELHEQFNCESGLRKLEEKLRKLKTFQTPDGFRERAWTEVQRAFYPLRASTLAKLREQCDGLRDNLSGAISAVELCLGVAADAMLQEIQTTTANVSAQLETMQQSVEGVNAGVQQMLLSDRAQKRKDLLAWLGAVTPWNVHQIAQDQHEPETGAWLLQSEEYKAWKAGDRSRIWLFGKGGCGKTVAVSSVFEDLSQTHKDDPRVEIVLFYFTFTREQEQSLRQVLCSIIAQLDWTDQVIEALETKRAESSGTRPLSTDEVEEMLIVAMFPFDQVYLLMDGIDEISEEHCPKERLFKSLQHISSAKDNLTLLFSSRPTRDLEDRASEIGAERIDFQASTSDPDILKYVESQMAKDRLLARLGPQTKQMILDAFAAKADGMFRWAYCQLKELSKLKSTKPKYVQAALSNLPPTLDATYERMLAGIEEIYRPEVLTAVRWLAFSRRPLNILELRDVCIVEPSGSGVDFEGAGSPQDVLVILAGLVTVERIKLEFGIPTGAGANIVNIMKWLTYRVRLAHFSVKEYLMSERISQSQAKDFALDSATAHRFIADSALYYLRAYSRHADRTSSTVDLLNFPLLRYAAMEWNHHSIKPNLALEEEFLYNPEYLAAWLDIYKPDRPYEQPFSGEDGSCGNGLYYAALLGLREVVNSLINKDDSAGGYFGSALGAAAAMGHKEIVQDLLEEDASQQSGALGSPLVIACLTQHTEIVEMLAARKVNERAWHVGHSNVLHLACHYGYTEVVRILLRHGSDPNALFKEFADIYDAIRDFAPREMERVVGKGVTALQSACSTGHLEIVRMLISAGAALEDGASNFGNALQAACFNGRTEVTAYLLDQGMDINSHGGIYGNALEAACLKGKHQELVDLLIARGARLRPNNDGFYSPLKIAYMWGADGVRMLLANGAVVGPKLVAWVEDHVKTASEEKWKPLLDILVARRAEQDAARDWFAAAALATVVCHRRVSRGKSPKKMQDLDVDGQDAQTIDATATVGS